jgi:hypothetical protein
MEFGPTFDKEIEAVFPQYRVATPDIRQKIRDAINAHDPNKRIVPPSVKRTSIRVILAGTMLADGTTNALLALDAAAAADLVLNERLKCDTYDRASPLVAQLGASFGLSDAQLDGIWIDAGEIDAGRA